MFLPPRSPYSLIQEDLAHSEMWLLIACCLLNRASRAVAQHVLAELMSKWPTAIALASATDGELRDVVKRLGLVTRRATVVAALARAAATGDDVTLVDGLGPYALRAHAIFCRDELGDTEPQDGPLKRYWRWRRALDDRSARDLCDRRDSCFADKE